MGLVVLLLIAFVLWLIWYAAGYVGLPQPGAKILQIILFLIFVIACLNFLLGLFGHPFYSLGHF